MATMDVAVNGDSSNGKPYSKVTENGILPTASGGLDMMDAGNVVSDELETSEEVDDEEPPMGEIKVHPKWYLCRVCTQLYSLIMIICPVSYSLLIHICVFNIHSFNSS